ncbi:hypothetical protein, partial [Paramuribaculum intestinale]|uniref:hypothetical protein n=1 Tax=Paramuribaculum intestinale TaxID=2094151 RepID=UPI002617FBA2
SVTLLSVIMIQYLLFVASKLLNISDIAKKNRQLFQAADSTFLWCSLSRTRVINRQVNKFLAS